MPQSNPDFPRMDEAAEQPMQHIDVNKLTVGELKVITFDELVDKGVLTEDYVERLMDMPIEPTVLPGSSFALYQISGDAENRPLRYIALSQLKEEALAFRAKVHTVAEDLEDTFFADKEAVEAWMCDEGFVVRPSADLGEVIVSDVMLHESTFYLKYGCNCCHVDGCNTRALDTLVDASRYEQVYAGPLPKECAGISDPAAILESIYYQMNMKHPAGYLAASMSVSDVVALTMAGQTQYYFTDRIGFQQLPDFQPKENPLRSAEMIMEDDYDMIDGTINNDSEQEAKSERSSVIGQLKECSEKSPRADHPHLEHPRKDQER